MPDICQYRTSTRCQHRQPVRDQHWQTIAEHRYHPRHMPALRPHLPVLAQYRARCKFLIGDTQPYNCDYRETKDLPSKLLVSLKPGHFAYFKEKKSARFAGTFLSRAWRAARFARKFERAQGARFDRRASRSVLPGPPLRARSCALRIRLSLFLII